jgi:hypothetical protein
MGKWYKVTKRINGRFYDYWQRTYRVGKSMKTENKYIGPALGRNDRVLLIHKISGARQERTIRSILSDGYAVVDDVSEIPYKATTETWDITLLKKGDPDARPHRMGITFKELAEQEAAQVAIPGTGQERAIFTCIYCGKEQIEQGGKPMYCWECEETSPST